MVDELLQARADPDAESDGKTALLLAANHGALPLLRRLLSQGAAVDQGPVAPLYAAAAQGHSDVVAELLAAGAEPGRRGPGDRTAAEAAERNGYPELARVVAENGARRAVSAPNVAQTMGLKRLFGQCSSDLAGAPRQRTS